MVDTKAGDAAGGGPLHHIGGIESPAKAHFDHAGIGRVSREGQKGCRSRDFEETGRKVACCVEYLLQQRGEHRVADQVTAYPDTFIVANEVRLCGDVDRQSFRFQHGTQKGAGGTLAVGACHMEHRRQALFRVAKPRQQFADHIQPDAALR